LLVGQSYGAYLARGIIYRKPALVDGLFMLCPLIIADRKMRNVSQHTPLIVEGKLLKGLTAEQRKDFESIAVIQTRQMWE